MSNFYRVACGDSAVWFDNERDAKQHFKDRARDDDQDGLPWLDTFDHDAILAELNRLQQQAHLRRIFEL